MLGMILTTLEMLGHTMAELRFSQRYNVVAVLMEADGKQFTPLPTRPFEANDKIWVLGHRHHIDMLAQKEEFNYENMI